MRHARLARACGALAACASLVWLYACAFQPLRLNWGDPWSDANVLTTIEYSARYGFLKTSFTDVLDVGPLTARSYRYTHYPPLSEIFYGVVRRFVGKADIGVYRLFAITFSGLALVALYRYVRHLFGETVAALAVTFFATNALFLQYADSIHQAPIVMCTGFGALAVGCTYLTTRRARWLAVSGALTFCCFLTSYDYFAFLPLAALGTGTLLDPERRATRRWLGVLLTAAALAIATKSAFVIGALGWHGFKDDFAFQFLERATSKFDTQYRVGLVEVTAVRVALYFSPLLYAIAAFHFVAAARAFARERWSFFSREATFTPALFLLAGMPFLLVFSQLAATQVLPMQCLLPYYAIGFAALCGRWLEDDKLVRSCAVVLGLVGWQLFHVATFRKSYLRPPDVERVRARLQERDENDFVFTNLLSDGPIQYYFGRHLFPLPDDPSWAAGLYRSVLGEIASDHVEIVFFRDPNTRFVDKSLWPLLSRKRQWGWLGAPVLYRRDALAAITAYDEGCLGTIAPFATKVLDAGDISVYELSRSKLRDWMRGDPILRRPTETIDFSAPESEELKLSGFRGKEPGEPYAWAVGHGHDKTVLTRRGVQFVDDGGAVPEAELLVNLTAGRAYEIALQAIAPVDGQTVALEVNDQPVGVARFPRKNEPHEVAFTVAAAALREGGIQTLRFRFGQLAEASPPIYAVPEIRRSRVGCAFEKIRFSPLP